jgi:hypothetical protein
VIRQDDSRSTARPSSTWCGVAGGRRRAAARHRRSDRTLGRWRARVAEWAEHPSAPMPAEQAAAARAAFDDDLDTATALQVLRRAEKDESIPAGARFELFAHLDRLFGLDLARDVGKPRSAALPPGAQALLDQRAIARASAGEQGLASFGSAPGRAGRARRGGDRHPRRPNLDSELTR